MSALTYEQREARWADATLTVIPQGHLNRMTEDNGTPAVLMADLWALARDWKRDRHGAALRAEED
jgi:hypothetical protein